MVFIQVVLCKHYDNIFTEAHFQDESHILHTKINNKNTLQVLGAELA